MTNETYRYTESGLDNVEILNMPVVSDDAGGKVYEVPNVNGLHKLIAHCIVTSKGSMSGKELRFIRTEMGLTQAELAELVKKDHQTVGRWERGDTSVDQNAEFLIRMLAADKLGLDLKMSVEDVARRCVPSAKFRIIAIDGSDPTNYRPMDKAA